MNEVGDEATGALTEALETCPCLQKLDVRLGRWSTADGEWEALHPVTSKALRGTWVTRTDDNSEY